MERYCSTGQSPQRAVAPTEEEVLGIGGTGCVVQRLLWLGICLVFFF